MPQCLTSVRPKIAPLLNKKVNGFLSCVRYHFSATRKELIAIMTVTDAYALNVCAPVGGFGHNNSTASSTAARVSGTATPSGNVSLMRNSTMMYNGPFNGTPLPFTGGSGVFRGCGMMVLAGLLVGGMAVAL